VGLTAMLRAPNCPSHHRPSPCGGKSGTRLRYYAVFEDGHLEIKTVADLVGVTKSKFPPAPRIERR